MIIAEQVPEIAEQIRKSLEEAGYAARVTESVYRTLEAIRRDSPDLLVIRDDFVTDGGGWIISEQAWEVEPRLPVVVLRSNPARESSAPANPGPFATLDTPLHSDELRVAIDRLLKQGN